MKYNLPQTEIAINKYKQYQQLYLNPNKTELQILEMDTLKEELTQYLFTTEDYNLLESTLIDHRDQIMKLSFHETATITTNWNNDVAPYTQDIIVGGITADDVPVISPIYSLDLATALLEKKAWNLISKIETAEDKITVTCFEEKPVTAINIQIKGA
jgi:hypothetical protein